MSGLIKICGLAREEDVRLAVDAAPDALGFVFWPRSPRAVTPEQVAAWTRDALPPGLVKVGVFVDQPVEEVRRIMDTAGLDLAQLHGNEDAAYLSALDRPAWKAVHVDRLPDPLPVPPALALLLDGGTVDMPGGSGVRVDTARAAAFVAKTPFKVLLAGGLKAGNVADAIRGVRPHGVDVSSGVESAPGQKDPEAVRAFVHNARRAFEHLSLETHRP